MIDTRPGGLNYVQPSKLAKWRETAGLSPRAAARYLRISPETYLELEAGRGECPSSLALDISQRTRMSVMPGDLPGCAVEAGDDEQNTGASNVGLSAPVVEAASGDVASTMPPAHAWSVPNRVFLRMAAKDIFTLDPQMAGELGMQLIRAAIAAVRS